MEATTSSKRGSVSKRGALTTKWARKAAEAASEQGARKASLPEGAEVNPAEGSEVGGRKVSLAEGSEVSGRKASLAQGSEVSSRKASLAQGSEVSSRKASLAQGLEVGGRKASLAQGSEVSSRKGSLLEGSEVTGRAKLALGLKALKFAVTGVAEAGGAEGDTGDGAPARSKWGDMKRKQAGVIMLGTLAAP